MPSSSTSAAVLHDKGTLGELRKTLADVLHDFEADCLVRVARHREPVPPEPVKPTPKGLPVMTVSDLDEWLAEGEVGRPRRRR